MQTDSKKTFRFPFKKKDKNDLAKYKSPMFQSPSHYWTASLTDFLRSKGSANVELSIDPYNKSLIRIFCQSVDTMVNYKSIEYNPRTTVQHVVDKMIKILRLKKTAEELILCETVGRCMEVDVNGGTKNKIAKGGQPSVFLEQNRRCLMRTDYILTVLNYWKPMYGFSRRLELSSIDKMNQMVSCDADSNCLFNGNDETSFPSLTNSRGSIYSSSDRSNIEFVDKQVQTEPVIGPPVAPRRKVSVKVPRDPHIVVLKGDDIESNMFISLTDNLQFGTPGSKSNVCLKRLSKVPDNEIVFTIGKEEFIIDHISDAQNNYYFCLKNILLHKNLFLLVNGTRVLDQMPLKSGDIIEIHPDYAFFFKDNLQESKINHYLNNSNIAKSESCEQNQESSSISSFSDSRNRSSSNYTSGKKKVSIDISGITIQSFDIALSQVLIHYLDDTMDLVNAVTFTLYLVRFCRESTRCSFTLDEMLQRISNRFCKTLQNAFTANCYLLASLKLSALAFESWLIYQSENYIETTEENRRWLTFLENYTFEIFDDLSNHICETSKDLSICFLDEDPFKNFDELKRSKEDNEYTMEKFLTFLNDTFADLSKIGCQKTSDVFKRVLASRVITSVTESVVTHLLSDMESFSWNKGIKISSQIEKFETWLTEEGVIGVYESDGFLSDISKLISNKLTTLKQMDWRSIRRLHKRIPPSVLRQFLSSLAGSEPSVQMLRWHPPDSELKEASLDVRKVLVDYLRLAETSSLFQPGITLQTDCFAIDKLIESVDFISLCTVLDTELIGMGETFQWMALPKPHSLVNFKNGRWVALRQSIGEDKVDTVVPARKHIAQKPNIPARKLHVFDSDNSSLSNKGDTITPSKRLIEKYMRLKGNMNTFSKSLLSLNDTEHKPQPPERKKKKGSISNLSQCDQMSCKDMYTSGHTKPRGSFSGKSCFSRIGRSDSFDSESSHPPDDANINSSDEFSDVERQIERMEKDIQLSDESNSYHKRHFKSSLSPSTENGFEDDDEMSIGLSASGLTSRMKNQSRSEANLVDINTEPQIEVELTKAPNESYGITIADGTQTNLKSEGIYICSIKRHSSAYRCGKIKPGDRILSINSYTVDTLSFQECLLLITKSTTSVKLLLEKSDLQRTMKLMSVYQ